MKSLSLTILFCLCFGVVQAQSLIGGCFSLDYNLLAIKQSAFTPDSIKSVARNFNPIRNGGISVGIPFNIKLNRFVLFRPQAVFNIMTNQVDFTMEDSEVRNIRIQNINVEFPLQLVFTDLDKKKGIAGVFGIRGGYKAQEIQNDNTQFLSVRKGYGLLDVGLGYRVRIGKQNYFMPELRASMGLSSILESGGTPYNLAIERMRQNRISVVFNFF